MPILGLSLCGFVGTAARRCHYTGKLGAAGLLAVSSGEFSMPLGAIVASAAGNRQSPVVSGW